SSACASSSACARRSRPARPCRARRSAAATFRRTGDAPADAPRRRPAGGGTASLHPSLACEGADGGTSEFAPTTLKLVRLVVKGNSGPPVGYRCWRSDVFRLGLP